MDCSYCNKSFENQTLLYTHIKLKHKCVICGFEHNKPQYFTIHLRDEHNLTLEQYDRQSIHNNVVPKCKCGCDKEVRWIIRHGFEEYLPRHKTFPKPKQRTVEESVLTVAKRKKTILDKYGVENTSQLPGVGDKISKGLLNMSEETKKIRRLKTKETRDNWTEEFKEEIILKDKATRLEKYADENYRNIEKNKQTCLAKYGVDNIRKSEQFIKRNKEIAANRTEEERKAISDKSRETKLNNTSYEGVNNIAKQKETLKNRHGVNNSFNIPYVKVKLKEIIDNRNELDWFYINEKRKETNLKDNDDENYRNIELAKKTKLEKYGIPWYNNPDKQKKTIMGKYNVEGFYMLRKRTKQSNAELIVFNSKKDNFILEKIVESKKFDLYHEGTNTLIELNGSRFHIETMESLIFEQFTSIPNDKLKEKIAKDNGFILIKIRSEDIDNKDYTIKELLELSRKYYQDFSYCNNTILLTGKYFREFINRNKNKHKKIKAYKKMLKKLLSTLTDKLIEDKFIDELFRNPKDITLNLVN